MTISELCIEHNKLLSNTITRCSASMALILCSSSSSKRLLASEIFLLNNINQHYSIDLNRHTTDITLIQGCHWKVMRIGTSWTGLWLEGHKHCYSYINNCWSEGSHQWLFMDPQHNNIPANNMSYCKNILKMSIHFVSNGFNMFKGMTFIDYAQLFILPVFLCMKQNHWNIKTQMCNSHKRFSMLYYLVM